MYAHHPFPTQLPATTSPEVAIEALYATGHSLHAQDRFSDAAAVFRIMIQAAPEDERGWLALGECHERAGHKLIALELYGAGTVAVPNAVRCELARFRLLYDTDRISEADEALEAARSAASELDDEELSELTEQERRARA